MVADNGKDYGDKTKNGWLTMKRNKKRHSKSFMIAAPKIYLGKLWSMVHPASPHKSEYVTSIKTPMTLLDSKYVKVMKRIVKLPTM